MVTNVTLTAVPGFKVGHYTDPAGNSGCTVILCPPNTFGTRHIMGMVPATAETERLAPAYGGRQIHAIFLTGGSVYGNDAASGVRAWLTEKGIGEPVPHVAAAAVHDRLPKRSLMSFTPDLARIACDNANDGPVPQGNVGAGTATLSGKVLGSQGATKTGLGSTSLTSLILENIVVGALVVANASGSILNPYKAQIIAGVRGENGELLSKDRLIRIFSGVPVSSEEGSHTTLAVVATNAKLDRENPGHLAQMASAAIARTTEPPWTTRDGDILFTLSCGEKVVNPNILGDMAKEALTLAMIAAAESAEGVEGIPAARDLQPVPYYRQAPQPGRLI